MNTKPLGVCLLVLACMLSIQSCRKGCTNTKAYNYQSSAKQEDGSCLYCDSVYSNGGSSSFIVMDNNSGSPFQGQQVMEVELFSNFLAYNGNGCKQLGRTSATDSCVATNYTAILLSEVSVNLTFSGVITVFNNGGTFTYSLSNVNIPPGNSVSVNLGAGGCQPPFSFVSGLVNSATFTYH